jgi:hypothetical protein
VFNSFCKLSYTSLLIDHLGLVLVVYVDSIMNAHSYNNCVCNTGAVFYVLYYSNNYNNNLIKYRKICHDIRLCILLLNKSVFVLHAYCRHYYIYVCNLKTHCFVLRVVHCACIVPFFHEE